MPRIQILELPTVYREDGSDETPFVIVIDEATDTIRADLGKLQPKRSIDIMQQALSLPLAEQLGARAILVFHDTIDIPDNAVPVDADGRYVANAQPRSSSDLNRLGKERDEARMWARHGYELGQRSCTWTDHGVAPDWLTEGWPLHFTDGRRTATHDLPLSGGDE